ncbi:hypothetical protein WDW37_07230 [Bdellovibrionota bacterium FG-1]
MSLTAVLVTLILTFSACRVSDLASATGQYSGFVTEKANGKTEQDRVVGTLAVPTASSQSTLLLSINSLDGKRRWSYTIEVTSRGQVSLLNHQTQAPTPLRSTNDSCFVNLAAKTGADAHTRVCFDGREVNLDLRAPEGAVTDISFLLDRADPTVLPHLETPAPYKVSELMLKAMNRNFASQVEFEHVVQARMAALNSHLNLLPHFTLNTILGLVSFSWSSIIRSVGDLAPFLLPTRWFRAKEAGFKSAAESAAWILMKADTANIAEGLAYTIARDTKSLACMGENRDWIQAIRQIIWERERLGLIKEHSTEKIDALLLGVDKAVLLLGQTVKEEFTDLAQVAGFFNPQAIQSIVVDTDLSIEHPITIDPKLISEVALLKSFELKQMDSLIGYAKTSRTERFFNWLDPTGEDAGAIGLGFGAYIAIGQSQIREMGLRRQQLQSILLQKVDNISTELTDSIQLRSLAFKTRDLQQSIVDHMLQDMSTGQLISFTDLTNALQEELRADLDTVNAEFAYLVSVSKLKRVQYEDLYAQAATPQAP